jgi:uncharacterized lipoprotein
MKRFLILGLLAVVLLSACAPSTTNQQVPDEGGSTLVTVYRSPT